MDAKAEAKAKADGIRHLAEFRKAKRIPDAEWELAQAHADERGLRLWNEWMEVFDPDGSWRTETYKSGGTLPGSVVGDPLWDAYLAAKEAESTPVRKPGNRRKK